MDWTWFLFSFNGRINRAKCWLGVLVWFATCFSFMTIFLVVVAGILAAMGRDIHVVSTTMLSPAFSLLKLPVLGAILWIVAATAVKRLHDRDKSAWWLIPLFVAPILIDRLCDWLESNTLVLLFGTPGLGLSIWCFVELFCLRGTRGPNWFGPDPLAPAETKARWNQFDELELVAPSAGPPAVTHVKRESHE